MGVMGRAEQDSELGAAMHSLLGGRKVKKKCARACMCALYAAAVLSQAPPPFIACQSSGRCGSQACRTMCMRLL